MRSKKIKKIVTLAVLISLACCLSYFDSYICSLIPIGMLRYKLGLANIVIMVILYNYGFKVKAPISRGEASIYFQELASL